MIEFVCMFTYHYGPIDKAINKKYFCSRLDFDYYVLENCLNVRTVNILFIETNIKNYIRELIYD